MHDNRSGHQQTAVSWTQTDCTLSARHEIRWSEAAPRLAQPNLQWNKEVVNHLLHLPQKTKLGIACSGGADSVCVTLMAWHHLRERFDLCLLHFNHNTRIPGSDRDARFVAAMGNQLGIRLLVGQRNQSGPASEAELREQRLGFFKDSGCHTILLGHHAGDVAENLLMRLFRGAGSTGLAAPRPISRVRNLTFLRPALETAPESIRNALRDAGATWVEDASNASEDYLRNRIRHNVLPLLQAADKRDFLSGCARTRRLLQEESDALDTWLNQLCPPPPKGEPMQTQCLLDKPVALYRRAVLRWLGDNGLINSFATNATEQILTALVDRKPLTLNCKLGRIEVTVTGCLRLHRHEVLPDWKPCFITPGTTLFLSAETSLRLERVHLDPSLLNDILRGRYHHSETVFLDANATSTPLLVRRWNSGDRYAPLGLKGLTRKLQDAFTNAKIPPAFRHLLPVITTADHRILWVPGLPPAHAERLTIYSKVALRLTYTAGSGRVPDSTD